MLRLTRTELFNGCSSDSSSDACRMPSLIMPDGAPPRQAGRYTGCAERAARPTMLGKAAAGGADGALP